LEGLGWEKKGPWVGKEGALGGKEENLVGKENPIDK
jgi:hypothetical protein